MIVENIWHIEEDRINVFFSEGLPRDFNNKLQIMVYVKDDKLCIFQNKNKKTIEFSGFENVIRLTLVGRVLVLVFPDQIKVYSIQDCIGSFCIKLRKQENIAGVTKILGVLELYNIVFFKLESPTIYSWRNTIEVFYDGHYENYWFNNRMYFSLGNNEFTQNIGNDITTQNKFEIFNEIQLNGYTIFEDDDYNIVFLCPDGSIVTTPICMKIQDIWSDEDYVYFESNEEIWMLDKKLGKSHSPVRETRRKNIKSARF